MAKLLAGIVAIVCFWYFTIAIWLGIYNAYVLHKPLLLFEGSVSNLASSVLTRNVLLRFPQLDFGQFSSSSGAWNAEHRIVLEDVVGTLEHEFHAAEVAEGAPATMDVGPIKQLEAIRIGDGAQPGDGI